MSKSSQPTTALAVLEAHTLAEPRVKKFGEAIARTFGEIAHQERMNPQRAIIVGLALPILKQSMKHGQWEPWKAANLTNGKVWTKATALKNASLYTRLAAEFVRQVKPDAEEVLAITAGGTIALHPCKDAAGAKLVKRIEEFVGEKSLSELIAEHVSDTPKSTPAGSNTPAIAADDNTLLQDLGEWVANLRKTVTDPEQLKRFTPAALKAVETQLSDILEDHRKALEALKGK